MAEWINFESGLIFIEEVSNIHKDEENLNIYFYYKNKETPSIIGYDNKKQLDEAYEKIILLIKENYSENYKYFVCSEIDFNSEKYTDSGNKIMVAIDSIHAITVDPNSIQFDTKNGVIIWTYSDPKNREKDVQKFLDWAK